MCIVLVGVAWLLEAGGGRRPTVSVLVGAVYLAVRLGLFLVSSDLNLLALTRPTTSCTCSPGRSRCTSAWPAGAGARLIPMARCRRRYTASRSADWGASHAGASVQLDQVQELLAPDVHGPVGHDQHPVRLERLARTGCRG